MMGFRTHDPKIWHLGMLNISSGRNLTNSRYRQDFLNFLLNTLSLTPWLPSPSPATLQGDWKVCGDLLLPLELWDFEKVG